MTRTRFILPLAAAAVGYVLSTHAASEPAAAESALPAGAAPARYPSTGIAPVTIPVSDSPATAAAPSGSRVASQTQFWSPTPVVQRAPEIAPLYLGPADCSWDPATATVVPLAPGSTVVPLPSHTPGSLFGPPSVGPPGTVPGSPLPPPPPVPPAGPLYDIAPGGMVSPQFGFPTGHDAPPPANNQISLPVTDEELAWDQIVDVVSGYFTIAREDRARRGGDGTEGRINTVPQTGATWLEPHRGDSVGEFNRWESTFQTIRRRAIVRVIPDAAGYTVEVIVEKELEHMPQPEHATAGAASFRNDGSLPSRRADHGTRTLSSPSWIALGRDPPLEQRILADIHARFAGVTTTRSVWP